MWVLPYVASSRATRTSPGPQAIGLGAAQGPRGCRAAASPSLSLFGGLGCGPSRPSGADGRVLRAVLWLMDPGGAPRKMYREMGVVKAGVHGPAFLPKGSASLYCSGFPPPPFQAELMWGQAAARNVPQGWAPKQSPCRDGENRDFSCLPFHFKANKVLFSFRRST